ncbi:3'-5' exonuclease [Adhaeribacter pallidiroseus]|uniref:DNA-directed DNA polymerase n=1 Tax=Adhaeribacter pallidiroseus TaxID=2072847 RepID=A0A369QFL2_9BACT|nr:3'-5' exonuclease [Adhaeribacter pallidiroseus]RDC63711.1 DNA-directed DNA polymerase [Adhaeribacter pallidiroseus]
MREYLLFIDTEATGLPKNWNAPFSLAGNWPHAVQVSWIIYSPEGQLIKLENHYIHEADIQITPSAFKVHGITSEYLKQHGESRTKVLTFLANDLAQFQPVVVGHFMKFDALVLGADYYRMGWENPLALLPTFCTMEATTAYVRNPRVKYLRLGDLYAILFKTTLKQQHNALVDARATAECFFELVKRHDINLQHILQQEIKQKPSPAILKIKNPPKRIKYGVIAFILFLFTLLLYYWL